MNRAFILRLPVFGLLALACYTAPALAAERYRVEALVFRHTNTDAEPAQVDELRIFRRAFDPAEGGVPPTPVMLEEAGTTFQSIRSRLQRLADYEPLALVAWEQSQVDYHPPVRTHDAEIIMEEVRLPRGQVYLDLTKEDAFEPYLEKLYRLDGSIQLSRSRFLHLTLDLEYRVDDPQWMNAAPLPRVAEGEDPAEVLARLEAAGDGLESLDETPPEPFKVHRLQQSRQVKTNTLHYFDTAYLGALVRVTPIEEPR